MKTVGESGHEGLRGPSFSERVNKIQDLPGPLVLKMTELPRSYERPLLPAEHTCVLV